MSTRQDVHPVRVLARILWLVLLALTGAAVQCVVVLTCLALLDARWSLAVSLAVPIVGGLLGGRRLARRWDARAPVLGTVLALGILAGAATVLVPERVVDHVPPAGSVIVSGSGGDELAVRTYGDSRGAGDVPVVSIHGGPGVPFTDQEEDVLAGLGTDGPSVVYDQAGTGGSYRLDDPAGYTLARSVHDLHRVVSASGGGPVILLAYSWGARTAVAYAVGHPRRVAGMVLVSPGPFPWAGSDIPPYGPQDRLSGAARARLYVRALAPRNLFLYLATRVDPARAHALVDDAPADQRFAVLYAASAPGLTCSGSRETDEPRGLGFYASQVPQLHPDRAGVRSSALSRIARIPAVVLRGECDYLPPGTAAEYAAAWHGQVQDVPGAGHAVIGTAPAVVGAAVARLRAEVAAASADRQMPPGPARAQARATRPSERSQRARR